MNRLVIGLLCAGLFVAGCDEGTVIEVGSAQELLDALGPNRTLKLRADVEYRLDGLERGVAEFYRWEEVLADQYELIVRDCENLTIEGAAGETARIVTAHPYANVLHFENCSGLTLSNLTMGHAPDPGYCSGAVVAITDGADVVIEGATLFGCGMDGLSLRNVRGLLVARTTIKECTYGIVAARACSDLTFRDCRFVDNEEYYGFELADTTGVRLINCVMTNNMVSEYGQALFKTNLTTPDGQVVIRGGLITGNNAPQLAKPADMVILQDVSETNNSWQNADD